MASANLPFVTIDREVWNGDLLEFSLSAIGQKASGTALVLDNGVRLRAGRGRPALHCYRALLRHGTYLMHGHFEDALKFCLSI